MGQIFLASGGGFEIKEVSVTLPTASWTRSVEKTVTGTTDITEGTVTVDSATFLSQLPDGGTYVFTFNSTGSYWTYNDTQISLANYGISYTGTAVNGSKITVTVTVTPLEPFHQAVTGLSGITTNTCIDLKPDATSVTIMVNSGCNGVYITNNNGSLTAYAIAEKPASDITITGSQYEILK